MSRISVLIPAYNRPSYLKQALESVLNQTRLPDEIIIGDDNPETDENYKAVKEYIKTYPFIKYIRHEKNIGSVQNYKTLFNLASGDYIKWLADDDILMPDALEKLSYYLDKDPQIKLVTSVRKAVDQNLNSYPDGFISATKPLYKEDTILDGKEFIKKSLKNLINYGGEFSTYMFRKKDVYFELFKIKDLEFRTNADWFTWIMLARTGKVAYISKLLSLFRFTEENEQVNPSVLLRGFEETFLFMSDPFFNNEFPLKKEEKLFQINSFLRGLLKLENHPELKKDTDLNIRLQNLIEKAIKYNKSLYKKTKRDPVSIITVTYNSQNTLPEFLDSVLKSLSPQDELIIVDNNSKDKTKEILKSIKHKNLKVIFNQENYGYSKGINTGIKASKNPYLIFLNPDTVVPQEWIDLILHHFDEKNVGGVSPLSDYAVSFQHYSVYFNELAEFENKNLNIVSNYIKNKAYKKSKNSKLLIGFCFATKREILEKVGYLDENLFLGNDDLEISWRLRENGYSLKIALDTFVHHKGHESFKTESRSTTDKLVQESTNKLAEKLIDYYGYGNVPHPLELWGIDWFVPHGEKYKFMFRINGKKADIYKSDNIHKKVSAIIVSYKNVDDVVLSALSLINQDYEKLSIIIVDNSEEKIYAEKIYKTLKDHNLNVVFINQDKASNHILKFNKDIVIIKSHRNSGFSGGNNIGIKLAQINNSDYVWILNPDTEVEKDSLYQMLKTSIVYSTPVVTCKIKDYYHKNKVQYNGKGVFMDGIPDRPDIIRVPDMISGANILIETTVFKDIGYWDEDFFLYFEDNYFKYKIKGKKIPYLYTPYTCIYHRGGGTTGGFLNSITSVYYVSRNLFLIEEKIQKFNFEHSVKITLEHYNLIKHNKNLLKAMYLGIYDYLLGVKGKREKLEKSVKEKEYTGKLTGNTDLDNTFKNLFKKPRNEQLLKKFLENVLEVLQEKYAIQPL